MTIDLREDISDFRKYVCRTIEEHVKAGKSKPRMIQFGFTFDQSGWILAYIDNRPSASRDGEWTTHIAPETVLPRPHWYEASELSDLGNIDLIGVSGEKVVQWSTHQDLPTFATILGEFVKCAVAIFITEGIFQPLVGNEPLSYCVEEFTGLYGWPTNPEIAKLVHSPKLS